MIGPGGVGKSTVGERLAERLGYAFVDLDTQFANVWQTFVITSRLTAMKLILNKTPRCLKRYRLSCAIIMWFLRCLPVFLQPIFARISFNATASACGSPGVLFCLCRQRMSMSRVTASLRVSLNADLGSNGIKKRPSSASDFPTIWRWAISRFSQWAHRKSSLTKSSPPCSPALAIPRPGVRLV